jgi:hypothetical protein
MVGTSRCAVAPRQRQSTALTKCISWPVDADGTVEMKAATTQLTVYPRGHEIVRERDLGTFCSLPGCAVMASPRTGLYYCAQ